MGAEEIKILHVDDEESILTISQTILEEFDPHLRISNITSPIKALKELESKEYDIVLSDYKMPEMNGIQLAEKIIPQGIPFILYTGRGSEEVAEAAFKVGVDDYVRKEVAPAHLQVLARRIRQIVEQARGEKSLKASEEKFRLFFMNQPVLCYIVSKDGDIVEVNETVLDTLGYTREELIGKPAIPTLYALSSRGKAEKLFRSWMETGRIRAEELNIVTKTGEERTVLLNVDAVRDASGDFIQSISVQADITQRKQVQEHLRESEERYRTLVENSPNAISVTVGDTIVYANQKRADLAGKNDPSELVGISALSQVAEVDREPIIKIREARERGEEPPSPFEYRMTRADGNVRDIMDYHSEISYQGANAVQHVLHDITEEKRYEKRLEALHRHATDLGKASTMDDIAERTLNAIKNALGYDQGGFGLVEGSVLHFKHMIGVSVGKDFEIPLDGKGVTVKVANIGRTVLVNDLRGDPDFVRGYSDSFSELATPVLVDGETVAVLNIECLSLNAFTKEDQGLLETLAQHVASALSRLREVEKLRASEERYRTFLESSRDAVFVFNEDRYIYVNRAAVDILGYDYAEEMIGLPSYSLVASDDREEEMRRTAVRARGEVIADMYEVKRLRRDGGVKLCEANVSMIMYEGKPVSLSVDRDITERKKMKEPRREAHGGSITAESKAGEGTTFTVTLPLHPGAQPENPCAQTSREGR